MQISIYIWAYFAALVLILNAAWMLPRAVCPLKVVFNEGLTFRIARWFVHMAIAFGIGCLLDKSSTEAIHMAYYSAEFYATFFAVSVLVSIPGIINWVTRYAKDVK